VVVGFSKNHHEEAIHEKASRKSHSRRSFTKKLHEESSRRSFTKNLHEEAIHVLTKLFNLNQYYIPPPPTQTPPTINHSVSCSVPKAQKWHHKTPGGFTNHSESSSAAWRLFRVAAVGTPVNHLARRSVGRSRRRHILISLQTGESLAQTQTQIALKAVLNHCGPK
jgi:hypothetical protein